MNLPTVFEPGRRPWVDPTQAASDAVARVVAKCPTGALHFERGDGGEPEPTPAANTVLVTRRGPLHLRGDIEVLDDQGQVILRDTRVALCRCGLSTHRPLCDNTHAAAGFQEDGALREPERVEDPGASETKLRVVPRAGGPLELLGPFAIAGADRKTMLAGTRTKLCRCGQSGAKPFCDGSHKRLENALESFREPEE
jgi:CDGSH-type Zn-finger protein